MSSSARRGATDRSGTQRATTRAGGGEDEAGDEGKQGSKEKERILGAVLEVELCYLDPTILEC